ncbi:hypothetical protein [Actinoplanes sp. TFC3]|uniref:hypothetical protein n=1 Tax=Actinoplanes sp. TFC3 TaxID=1710355 RepID=UPI00082D71A7|nr:hypothetical protein [Actinoplanes sp. TFC3]
MSYMSEEEYRYLVARLRRDLEYYRREDIRAFDAFCEWLNYIGFGWLTVGLRIGNSVWRGVRGLWRRMFG